MHGMIVAHGETYLIKPGATAGMCTALDCHRNLSVLAVPATAPNLMDEAPSNGERTKAVPLFTNEKPAATTRHHLVYRALDAPDQPEFACGASHEHPDHEHGAPAHAFDASAAHHPHPGLADASGPFKSVLVQRSAAQRRERITAQAPDRARAAAGPMAIAV
jgi:hypothetical protein